MGGDLTFECQSPGVYLWRLKLYRDCFGIPTNTVQPITISGCGSTYNLTLQLVSGPIEVSPLCPGQIQNSACNGGSLPGVQQVIYEGVINLPNSCTNYVASWRLCCRNNQITTLNNPGSQYMYIETVLDNTVVPCNNSPVFNNIPTPYVCVGQPVNYNHGVTDPDGDLLVFSLVDCFHDAGVPVDYLNPPYSPTYPLSTVSGTVNLDTQTGAISFTPDIIQIGVMCVKVEEFRNGVKIGETVRDMQFVVLPCNNTPPDAGPFEENGTNTGSYDYFICTGTSFCLQIPGGDLDGDNVFMSWNSGIPAGTFTVTNNNTPNPTGTFCWTPTPADLGVNFFTVTEVDDACPISGVTVATYTIIVADNASPITATISPNPATICRGISKY